MFRNLIMSFCLLQSQGSTKPASTKPASTKPASTKPTSTKSTTTKNTKSKCSTKSNRKFAAQKLHFSTANKSKATAEVVLVVEDSEDSDVDITEPSSQKTKWVQSMSRNDRAILLSPVAWLNDNNVYSCSNPTEEPNVLWGVTATNFGAVPWIRHYAGGVCPGATRRP